MSSGTTRVTRNGTTCDDRPAEYAAIRQSIRQRRARRGVAIVFAFLASLTLLACLAYGHTMPTQYNGIPANIVEPAPVTILSSTNANPAVVTTTAAHGMTSGDRATIHDHTVNTAINGNWPVTVLSSTTFSVPVAGNGNGGNTGIVLPQGMGATYQIPSDGDPLNASSVNVGLETLGDRTALLATWTGAFKVAGDQKVIQSDPSGITTSFYTMSGTGSGSLNQVLSAKVMTITALLATGVVTPDQIEIQFDGAFLALQAATQIECVVSLAWVNYAPGVAPGAAVQLIGSAKNVSVPATSSGPVPVTLKGWISSAGSGAPLTVNGSVDLYLLAFIYGGGGAWTVKTQGDVTANARVWRATLQSQ